MSRRILYIWPLLLLFSGVFGQNKDDLQKEKQRAYNELKLARELMEKTSAQASAKR